ncbi:site-specific DNA-methyltransferase [Paenibacillus sp. FSL W8-1287]|uniref:DNA-methyltransferase n=1 Tax=Paenibacillus sp. FSL W8-1287 TaxID=2954653 RepID=UPI0030D3687A
MILQGNCIEVMPQLEAESFNICVTSPPYWALRDYGLPPTYWPEVTYTPMPGLPPITVPEWIGCLGLEPTPEMFVAHMVLVFREVWRLLRKDGTLWMNFGDSYAKAGIPGLGDPTIGDRNLGGMKVPSRSIPNELKPKDLIGIPWRVAFALQADGWYLRMDNIWSKPNCMPESVTDRPTKAHEYMFLLSKSERYYYDGEAIKEALASSSIARLSQDLEGQRGSDRANGGAKINGRMKAVGGSLGAFGPPQSRRRSGNKERKYGEERDRPGSQLGASIPWEGSTRNKRSVWTVPTAQFTEAHFATFPEKLIEPCILAGAPVGGRVLDPFGGSGTTLKVALENNRECTIIEMGLQYVEIAERRTAVIQPTLNL